ALDACPHPSVPGAGVNLGTLRRPAESLREGRRRRQLERLERVGPFGRLPVVPVLAALVGLVAVGAGVVVVRPRDGDDEETREEDQAATGRLLLGDEGSCARGGLRRPCARGPRRRLRRKEAGAAVERPACRTRPPRGPRICA